MMEENKSQPQKPEEETTASNPDSIGIIISKWYHDLPDFKKILYFSLVIPIIFSLIAGGFCFLMVDQYSKFHEEKAVAKGIKIDIITMEPNLNDYNGQWDTYQNNLNNGVPNITPQKYHSNHYIQNPGLIFFMAKKSIH